MDTSSSEEESSQNREEVTIQLRRSSRQVCPPEKYKYYALMSNISNVIEPMSFNEANEHEEWIKTMEKEYDSIMKNKTWELTKLTELPKGKNPIGCKWIYKPKFKADGSIDKYKSKLMAKRYSQKEGIDYA
jgi:predicted choloylglycine hydrolase